MQDEESLGIMSKKKDNELVPTSSDSHLAKIPAEREGYFKQGVDKWGHPYDKKQDSNGLYSKTETLNDGTQKLTLKKKP